MSRYDGVKLALFWSIQLQSCASVVLIYAQDGKSINNLFVLSGSMPGFCNGHFRNATIFQFALEQIFSNWVVSVITSAITSATAAASAAGASLALSISSGDLVLVGSTRAIVGVSVCLRHDTISFVVYRYMR